MIAELESTRREAYTGAIGFASPVAGLELSVTIRSFEFGPAAGPAEAPTREAWLGVGGGIVADSEPRTEAEECYTKALPLLGAIDAELAHGAPEPLAPPLPRRFGSKPIPRPDPAAGVFETILVDQGSPRRLEAHLERLARSVAELYRQELPSGLAAMIEQAAAGAPRPLARLRIDLRPDRALTGTEPTGTQAAIAASPLPERRAPSLAPVCLPGGSGAHKWADRTLLDRFSAAVAPHIPLLCDLDGQVLEAVHAAVFADLGDGRLITPPLDGRILPSIARADLLAGRTPLPAGLSGAVEEPLSLTALASARGIYIANSLAPSPRKVTLAPGA